MNKKLQFVIWIIVAIAAIALIGIYGVGFVRSKVEGTIHPVVTFEIENHGTVKAELYPEYAPNTVATIVTLVKNGFYENKVIYGKDQICLYVGRDTDGNVPLTKVSNLNTSVASGSDADKPVTIPGEFAENGFTKNTLRHEKGVLSLIRNDYTQSVSGLVEESYNSGVSQIGIMMGENTSNLNGVYAAFGKVTEGLDILEKLYTEAKIQEPEVADDGTVQETAIDKFATFPIIKSATIETYGVDFGLPVFMEAFDYESYMYDLIQTQYGS